MVIVENLKGALKHNKAPAIDWTVKGALNLESMDIQLSLEKIMCSSFLQIFLGKFEI